MEMVFVIVVLAEKGQFQGWLHTHRIWESGWNTSTGLSVGDIEEEFNNSDIKMTKTGIRINLELSIGYRF